MRYVSFLLIIIPQLLIAQNSHYSWIVNYSSTTTIQTLISPPVGYERTDVDEGSITKWLRGLPLKPLQSPVYLYNGELKGNQEAQHAVINMDVGKRDLQQCADAVMRLKAEYHYSKKEYDAIHFNLTSGDRADYTKWIKGYRARISGNRVSWVKTQSPSSSYTSFKKYMNFIFTYAGTYSLSKELTPVDDICDIQAGDVFIMGGFPGHAVMVVDVARSTLTGHKVFLLAQSYMPAQEMHILKNPTDTGLGPWYQIPEGELYTPEWTFSVQSLYRFTK